MFAALKRLIDPRERLKHALGNLDVPSFPAVTTQVLSEIRKGTNSKKIGALVAQDPGLSVQVLKLVNSAAFGLRKKVEDPTHAAVLLGRAHLESVVLSVATKAALPQTRTDAYDPQAFWRCAAHRAATAGALAGVLSPSRRMVCFTAGLLQDMAVPLLAHARPDYRMLTPHEEREVHGFDHVEVAGWLAEAWEFPDAVKQAIVGHHGANDAAIEVQITSWVDPGAEPDAVIAAANDLGLAEDVVVNALEEGRSKGEALAQLLR